MIKKKKKVFEEMTFEKDDKLDRKFIADNFNDLFEDIEEPFVIALNSPWGDGKTQFIYMWQNLLAEKNKESSYINLWEEDYLDNPFYSLVETIINKNSSNNELKKKIRKASFEIIRGLTERFSGINIKNISGKNLIENLSEEKKKFKQILEEFSQKIKESTSFPLVIFIDEIDRCRPDYAIKFLEVIKHFFDVKNIVFVLGIDIEQLQHSVRATYGQGMNAKEYLRKFIDLIYSFPEPELAKYIDFLFEQFDCGKKESPLLNISKEIIKKFRPSLRGIDNLFIRLNLIEDSINQPYVQAVFLLSLKEFDEKKYNNLIRGTLKIDELFEFKKYFKTQFKFRDRIIFWKLINEIILRNSNLVEDYLKNMGNLLGNFEDGFLEILNSYQQNDGFRDNHFSINSVLDFFNKRKKIITKKEMSVDESDKILSSVFRSKKHYLKEFDELINRIDFLDGLDFSEEKQNEN